MLTMIAMFMAIGMGAQQADGRKATTSNFQTYKITYVDERKLFRQGDEVTLVSLRLEWPERLSGTDAAVLQGWLCTTLFGNECASLEQGKKVFYESLGKEIGTMPDGPGIQRKNISLTLTEMAWDKDRYMSLRLAALHRNGDDPHPTVNVQRLITYDVKGERILTTKDLIKRKFMPENLSHLELVTALAMVMPDLSQSLCAEDIPDQVCLLGKSQGVAFSLKNMVDDEGLDKFVRIQRNNALDYFLTSTATRLLDREDVGRKKAAGRYVPPKMDEVMEDGQPVYLVVDSMPRYADGVAKMMEFLMQQMDFTELERALLERGRVVVTFVVRPDGSICRPSVALPLMPAIDRAAVKAVLDMKPWIPGKLHGTPVNVRVAVPFEFRL